MRATRRIKAENIQIGDIFNGQKVKAVHTHAKRNKLKTGIILVMPATSGYGLDVVRLAGEKFIEVKRPKYNLAN